MMLTFYCTFEPLSVALPPGNHVCEAIRLTPSRPSHPDPPVPFVQSNHPGGCSLGDMGAGNSSSVGRPMSHHLLSWEYAIVGDFLEEGLLGLQGTQQVNSGDREATQRETCSRG